jgi:hypothetical protein
MQEGHQRRMSVYLDRVELHDGERFAENFVKALASTVVLTPLLSIGCIQDFVGLGTNDKEDFVLAEWLVAIELQKAGLMKLIFPIALGSMDTFGEWARDFFENLRNGVRTFPMFFSSLYW